MKISNEKIKRLSDDLKEKWRGRACQMCQTGNWIVQDTSFELREFNQGSLIMGGLVMPVIPVVCSNCSITIFISAIQSGIVSVDKEAKND